MSQPDTVHVPVPLGGKKRKHPAFLTKLAELLKSYVAPGVFADAVKAARSHAGGTAKAEASRASEGDPTGVAVVLPIAPDVAATLAIEGGEAPEDLHLTLCMLGDVSTMDGVRMAEALLAVRDAGLIAAPLTAAISGVGRFQNVGDGQDAVVALVDSPDLNDLWDIVCDELEEAGLECSNDHGFTPHITLAYVESGAPLPIEAIGVQALTFDALALWAGTNRTTVPLLGIGDDGDMEEEGGPAETYAEPIIFDMQLARQTFAEAPAWIPYLPRPGVYPHPKYGEIKMTPERIARFIANFAAKVYQDRIPIDLEHETKLSGAAGWVTAMRQNADGSADAAVEWTDRGRQALASDRFKFFSPEWYDAWQSPLDGTTYQDVAIGGALTTRPFFKDPALRPLVASEQPTDTPTTTTDDPPPGTYLRGDHTWIHATGGTPMSEPTPAQFAEMQTQLNQILAENTALKSANEQASAQSTKLAEQIAAMQTDARKARFTALARGTADGQPNHRWFGETAQHVSVLETFAQTFGEDAPQFKAYVEQQQAIAAQIATSAAFRELGSDAGGRVETNEEKLDRMAAARASEKNITVAQAYNEVLDENPALYSAA